MQKRNKPVQATFVFAIKQILLKVPAAAAVQVCVRRKDKAAISEEVNITPDVTVLHLKDRIEFPTTIEQDPQRQGYKPKPAHFQVRATISKDLYYQSSTEIDLAEFVGSEPLTRRLKLQGTLDHVQADIVCYSNVSAEPGLQKFSSMANLQAKPLEANVTPMNPTKQQQAGQAEKSQKTIGLAPRKKEKTLLIIPEAAGEETAADSNIFKTVADGSEVKRALKRAMTTTNLPSRPYSFGAEEPQRVHFQKQNEPTHEPQPANKSPSRQPALEQHRPTAATTDNKHSPESEKKREAAPSLTNFKSSTSIDCKLDSRDNDSELRESKQAVRKLRDQLKQMEKECRSYEQTNARLGKQTKELADRIEILESSERNSEQGKQKMVKRLYEDLDGKNKQIKALEAEASQLRSRLKSEEQDVQRLKRQTMDLKLEREKLSLEIKSKVGDAVPAKDDKRLQRELDRMRAEHEEEIKELKSQLKKATSSVQDTVSSNNEICLSKACEQQKKQLKSKMKALSKTIEEKEKQLDTKERLIKNYESIKKDREAENSSLNIGKEFEKWRAERLVLEQQIQDLQRAREEPLSKRPTDELLTYKVEKENLSKELQRTRRNLNQITKEKENLQVGSKDKEQAIVKTKQKVVDLLNAIQEHGGMELYQTICNLIQ